MDKTTILARLDTFYTSLETLGTTSLIKKQKVKDTCSQWYSLIENDRNKYWNDDKIIKYEKLITLSEQTLIMFNSMIVQYLNYDLRNIHI